MTLHPECGVRRLVISSNTSWLCSATHVHRPACQLVRWTQWSNHFAWEMAFNRSRTRSTSWTCETRSFPFHMDNQMHLQTKISHLVVFTFSVAQHVMENVSRPSEFHQFTIKYLLQLAESNGLVKHQCWLRGVENDMENLRFIKWFVISAVCFSQFCSFKWPQSGSCFNVVSKVLQRVMVLTS